MSPRQSNIRAARHTLLLASRDGRRGCRTRRSGVFRNRDRRRYAAAAGSGRTCAAAARRLCLGRRTLGVERPSLLLDIRNVAG